MTPTGRFGWVRQAYPLEHRALLPGLYPRGSKMERGKGRNGVLGGESDRDNIAERGVQVQRLRLSQPLTGLPDGTGGGFRNAT
jgi:hypothetical protein